MGNHWIQTHTGRKFSLTNPQPEDIRIEDIAHALSLLCRFTGHTKEFYSVAQHSISVCQMANPENKLWGLLHDASEAYTGDLNRQIKSIPEIAAIWKPFEDQIQRAIAAHFNLGWPEPAEISIIDRRMCMTEKRDLMSKLPWPSDEEIIPFVTRINTTRDPQWIKSKFLNYYFCLMDNRTIS